MGVMRKGKLITSLDLGLDEERRALVAFVRVLFENRAMVFVGNAAAVEEHANQGLHLRVCVSGVMGVVESLSLLVSFHTVGPNASEQTYPVASAEHQSG
jgi:hypothetical protein